MSIDFEKREGLRLLTGLENGNLNTADAFNVADQRDPVIVYFVLRYLREKYPATQPAGAGVTRRLVELTTTYDGVVAKAKQGEKDSITEWFDDTYTLHEFFDKPEELMELIIEKIEG
jgi:hypothetical protein